MLRNTLALAAAAMASASGGAVGTPFGMFIPPVPAAPVRTKSKGGAKSKLGFNYARRMRGKTYPFSSTRQDTRLQRQLARKGLTPTARFPNTTPELQRLPLAA